MAFASDGLQDFRPGTVRGTAGFFRVGQTADGKWWLMDPDDRRFFFRAANGVPAEEASAHDPVERLRAWGFNALGAGADAALRGSGLPFVAAVDFCAAGAVIRRGGARLPDVFDPDWPRVAALHAGEACLPWCERRDLIGWLADDDLGWAQPAGAGRPSLLQICLSLEPQFAAWHAAWEFALAPHGGRLDALARAWGVPLANKEVVRAMTRDEQGLATRGYLRDEARWTREFARRYFALTSAAIRAHDPHHLVLGARSAGAAGAAVVAACTGPAVDVAWTNAVDLAGAGAGPVVVGDFTWVSEKFIGEAGAGGGRGLTSVERMLRRGRLGLQRLAAHPAVTGYAWAHWRDGAGEQPPFARGLVHANDAEAREHTELLAVCNARVHNLHLAPPPALSPA
jgi:agarase